MFDEKILTEIEDSKGYTIALLTTFNFDINFFERKLLNTLIDNEVRKIELFIDSNELNSALNENRNNNLNKKYIANPIRINSTFHPKVILLLGEEKAKLIVSSANITLSGYTLNNEIFNVFVYDKDNKETLNLINNAINFFIKLNEIAYYKDVNIYETIENLIYYNKSNQCDGIKLIHNIDAPVIEQLKEIINENINSIDIAVPYYDNELLGYKDISEKFNCKNINLYIQNEKSTFPKEYNEQNNIVNRQQIKTYYKLKNNDKKNFYHGKVFRFNLQNKSFILYGSSNCTLSALSKTYHNGGNIECNILEIGEKTEFDYFFDNFNLDFSKELICNKMEQNIKENTNFYFKYGIRKEVTYLYFQYKNKIDNIIIKCDDNNLEYEYVNENLVVKLSDDLLPNSKNVFDIEIYDSSIKETYICWYIDIEAIEYIRNSSKEANLIDIKITDDIEKYRDFIERICKALALNKDEYNDRIKIARMLNHQNCEDDDNLDEDEVNDNFIIEQDVPDEYIKKIRDFSTAFIKSKTFSIRFFNGLRKPKESNESSESNNDDKKESYTTRLSTPAEKRFERFVKNRIKDILNKEYVDLIEYEHYKHNIGLMLDTINEFKYKENITDIFDDQFVIDSSIRLLSELLNKDNSNEEDKESTILLTLITVIENHIINESFEEKSYKTENDNKKLIKLLDKKYQIRESYKEFIEDIIYSLKNHKRYTSTTFVEKYIEELFEYKTKNQLINSIYKNYGDECIIELNGNVLNISSSCFEIAKYLNYIHDSIIKDIINYSKHYEKEISEVLVTIKNLKDNYGANADPIDKIIFEFNIAQKNYKQKIIRKSGAEDKVDYKRIRI